MSLKKAEAILAALGLDRAEDLVFHLPRRYEDRSRWVDPQTCREGDPLTVAGEIVRVKFARWGARRCSLDVWLQPEGSLGQVRLSWFNMPYLRTAYPEGKRIIAHGTVSRTKGDVRLFHPEVEPWEEGAEARIHVDRIVPIYPLVEGVGQKGLRRLIYETVSGWEGFTDDPLAGTDLKVADRTWAYRQIHFPDSWETLEKARYRLVFEELFLLQTVLACRRHRTLEAKRPRGKARMDLVGPWKASLPFELTAAQVRVCGEIDRDLEQTRPMNRLLQGDVGSGKTAVAVHAMLRALERGETAAFLAPTETLGQQQAAVLRRWLEPLGVRVELWTRTSKPGDAGLFASVPTVHVGTHALLEERVNLGKLGLAVIDEQHKFGVLQRGALLAKGDQPDLLVMTATPIPRTLCLAYYGDLDISVLDSSPAGRGRVKTVVRTREHLPAVWDFMKKELAAGRQAFVVFPVIDESEKADLKALASGAEELKKVFGAEAVRVLHGRMKSEEKETVMAEFRAGQFGVLAATSVIEVGVDIPNASLMVVENAERFGLASLHQLRGRVGRGAATSYCVLIAGDEGAGRQRLEVMERTGDGFVVAEEDFRQRGPGDILGTAQSGLPPLVVSDLLRDGDILAEAKRRAESLVVEDPDLIGHPGLRRRVAKWLESGPLRAT
ncbi:MAG: ATP-dependent DNA helicase RecG [Candidatus Methylacidiphilales bacterium]